MQNLISRLNHTWDRGYASLITQMDAFLFEMRLPYPICTKSEGSFKTMFSWASQIPLNPTVVGKGVPQYLNLLFP